MNFLWKLPWFGAVFYCPGLFPGGYILLGATFREFVQFWDPFVRLSQGFVRILNTFVQFRSGFVQLANIWKLNESFLVKKQDQRTGPAPQNLFLNRCFNKVTEQWLWTCWS